MYWLVLWLSSSTYTAPTAMVIIPEKYPTEQVCKEAGKSWLPNKFECIKTAVAVELSKPCVDPSGTCKLELPTGYYCGQYPERCMIDNMPKCTSTPRGLECKTP